MTLARRRRRGRGQLLNRADARSRFVKFVVGGLVVPVAALWAAARVEVRPHETPLSLALRSSLVTPPAPGVERLGAAVRSSKSREVTVQGIAALRSLGSDEALGQLLRVLDERPAVLRDGAEREALSKALASFGPRAVPELVRRFDSVPVAERLRAPGPPGDLYDRTFAGAFEAAEDEVRRRAADPSQQGAELGRLQAARADLQRALAAVEADVTPPSAAAGLPGFVLQTFLRMDAGPGDDLLAFARRVAADSGWSEAVRGEAILLVGRLGTKDDLERTFDLLDGAGPLLEARALQAIAALQQRVGAGDPGR